MTDYELYQLLEENGYEPSIENLDILKEGLGNGRYEISSRQAVATCTIKVPSSLCLTEGCEEYTMMQLLEYNGFEITQNNINVLAEAINNNTVILVEEDEEKKPDENTKDKSTEVKPEDKEMSEKRKRQERILDSIDDAIDRAWGYEYPRKKTTPYEDYKNNIDDYSDGNW